MGKSEPLRIVVMGVAGSGKTTVGEALADRLRVVFVDADGLHAPEHIAKMAAGIPLTDEERRPWLERLSEVLGRYRRVVLTCSSLKRSYRDILRQAGDVRFVHLDVDRTVLEERLAARVDHFMPAGMLDDQLSTLEPPGADEDDVVVVQITSTTSSLDEVVERTLAGLARS